MRENVLHCSQALSQDRTFRHGKVHLSLEGLKEVFYCPLVDKANTADGTKEMNTMHIQTMAGGKLIQFSETAHIPVGLNLRGKRHSYTYATPFLFNVSSRIIRHEKIFLHLIFAKRPRSDGEKIFLGEFGVLGE